MQRVADLHISNITGIQILICLSSKIPIAVPKLQAFCFQTAEIIIEKYPWLPMTVSVHKLLIHVETSLKIPFLLLDISEKKELNLEINFTNLIVCITPENVVGLKT